MTEQLDTQGEAREALSSMVTDYSKRVLSDPRMLRNLVTDLLPDLPRERSVLVTAAESDVAGELTRHVEEHHLDPDTAVQLVARSLTDRTALDPAASTWVTTEYAQALGYRVRSDAPPPVPQPPPPPPPLPPPAEHTVTSYSPYPSPQQFTAPQQDPAPGYPGSYSGYPPPQGPAQGQSPVGPPQQGPPPWQPPVQPPVQPPKKRNLGPILAAGGIALAVVVFFAIAAVAKIPPFSSAKPTPAPTPSAHHHTTPPASPRPTGQTLAAGVAPVMQLLPSDVNPGNCGKAAKPGWATPGLVTSLSCYDSGLSNNGDTIFAYQMDNFADYQKTWSNFNTFAGFNPSAKSSCPPSGSATVGEVPWHDTPSNNWFPDATGQIIECGTLSNSKNQNVPGYVWSYPSEDAYIIAIGSPNTAWSTLDKWWVANSEPNASPKPVTP